jgi:hypothetical protein
MHEIAYEIYTKSQIMNLCKMSFIMDQYNSKRELPDIFYWKSFISNFNSICKIVYGINGKDYLRPYANKALSWINTAENWNCQKF